MKRSRWTKEHLENLYRDFLGDLDPDSSQGRKRLRILKAATELFMKQGYRKTSVDEVAARARVAKGTVYVHFKSKSMLLMHVIGVEKRVLFKLLDPILSGEVPEPERLHFYLRIMLTVGRELPLIAKLMRGDNEIMTALSELDPQMLAENLAHGEEWLMELIEMAAPAAFSEEELRARADVVLGLRYFTILLLDEQVRAGRDLDEFARTFADMLVYGVINRAPETEGEGR